MIYSQKLSAKLHPLRLLMITLIFFFFIDSKIIKVTAAPPKGTTFWDTKIFRRKSNNSPAQDNANVRWGESQPRQLHTSARRFQGRQIRGSAIIGQTCDSPPCTASHISNQNKESIFKQSPTSRPVSNLQNSVASQGYHVDSQDVFYSRSPR